MSVVCLIMTKILSVEDYLKDVTDVVNALPGNSSVNTNTGKNPRICGGVLGSVQEMSDQCVRPRAK
jgi:hypothetical protein